MEPLATSVLVAVMAGEVLPLEQNAAAVYLGHLAPGGRPTMRHALEVIAGLLTSGQCGAERLDWSRLRYQHTAAVRAALAERYQPSTANRMLCALRGALRECRRLGQMSAEDCEMACDLGPIHGNSLPKGRALSARELQALFGVCADGSPAGARDAAVLALLYSGLRRSEAVRLDLADVDPETGAITVREGKGHKSRLTYASEGGLRALRDWLAVRGGEQGALLWPVLASGRMLHRRLTGDALRQMLRRRARQAGIAACSPHDLRRTWISDLLDAGADIALVQHLAGHATVATTILYDRRPEEARRKAASLLHVPYERRTR